MKTIRILLTGASGYLGQFVLESFLKKNNTVPQVSSQDKDDNDSVTDSSYHIHAIHHSNPNLKDAIDKYQQQQQCCASTSAAASSSSPRVTVQVDSLDLGNSDAVLNYLKSNPPIDVCIHAAAISSPKSCHERPDLSRRVNVAKPLFDALFAQESPNPLTVIALSTDQVYDGLDPPYLDEANSKTNPPNQYGQTKLEMEEYLIDKVRQQQQQQQQQDNQTKLYLLRCSIIFGPNAPFRELGVKTKDTFLHFVSSRKGVATDFYTDEIRCCVSVRDVVCIINNLVVVNHNHSNDGVDSGATDSSSFAYNVGGPDAFNRYDMAKAVFDHLGYENDDCLKPVLKSTLQPPPAIQTPMNLTMSSDKIQKLTGISKFKNFEDILRDTFSVTAKSHPLPSAFSGQEIEQLATNIL